MKNFKDYMIEGAVADAVNLLARRNKIPSEIKGELINLVNSELNNPKKVSDKQILDLAYGASMLDEAQVKAINETTIEMLGDVSFLGGKLPKGFTAIDKDFAMGTFTGQVYADYSDIDSSLTKFQGAPCVIETNDGIAIFFIQFKGAEALLTTVDFWDSITSADDDEEANRDHNWVADKTTNKVPLANILDMKKFMKETGL